MQLVVAFPAVSLFICPLRKQLAQILQARLALVLLACPEGVFDQGPFPGLERQHALFDRLADHKPEPRRCARKGGAGRRTPEGTAVSAHARRCAHPRIISTDRVTTTLRVWPMR